MIRKLALVGVIAAAALTGCVTYDQYGYRNGRGDYYYGRPQVSSSVGVSIGTGYGYGGYGGYGYGYPSGYGGYGYGGYGGYYGYPRYYGGRPYPGRPHHNHPRPPRPDGNAQTPGRKPGWRDLQNIRNQNRPPQPTRYGPQALPAQRAEARPEPRSDRGAFSDRVNRARRTPQPRPIEP